MSAICHRPGPALQARLARQGARERAGYPPSARRNLGLHFRGRMHQGLSEGRRSGRGHPALQAEGGAGMAQALLPLGERAVSPHRVPHDDRPAYTEFPPSWYRPRISTYWWLKRRAYLTFILRELSSVCVAWFVVFL